MPVVERTQFTYKGKLIELRVSATKIGYEVQAYSNGKPVNGLIHSLDTTSLGSFIWDSGSEVCNHLLQIAKRDVESDIWKRVLDARAKKN